MAKPLFCLLALEVLEVHPSKLVVRMPVILLPKECLGMIGSVNVIKPASFAPLQYRFARQRKIVALEFLRLARVVNHFPA